MVLIVTGKAVLITFNISRGLAWINRTMDNNRFLYDGPSSDAFSLKFLSGLTFSFNVRLCGEKGS